MAFGVEQAAFRQGQRRLYELGLFKLATVKLQGEQVSDGLVPVRSVVVTPVLIGPENVSRISVAAPSTNQVLTSWLLTTSPR